MGMSPQKAMKGLIHHADIVAEKQRIRELANTWQPASAYDQCRLRVRILFAHVLHGSPEKIVAEAFVPDSLVKLGKPLPHIARKLPQVISHLEFHRGLSLEDMRDQLEELLLHTSGTGITVESRNHELVHGETRFVLAKILQMTDESIPLTIQPGKEKVSLAGYKELHASPSQS